MEPEELIAPQGDLEPVLFPAETPEASYNELLTRVTAHLDEVEGLIANVAAANKDAARKAFVRWRIYTAVVIHITRPPASATLDSGKTQWSFLVSQMSVYEDLRDKAEAEFTSYLPVDPTPAEKVERSGSRKLGVGW